MILWTIQSLEVFEDIASSEKANEKYRAKWDRIIQENSTTPNFIDAYRWISKQMEDRGLDLNGYAPIWAWHTWTEKHPCPDLRSSGHLNKGTEAVRLTLEAPDNLVLLSDFDHWHHVLNKDFVSFNESEDNKYSQEEIEQSWQRIFDLKSGDPEWIGTSRSIQATIPWVERGWIKAYKFFKAR